MKGGIRKIKAALLEPLLKSLTVIVLFFKFFSQLKTLPNQLLQLSVAVSLKMMFKQSQAQLTADGKAAIKN